MPALLVSLVEQARGGVAMPAVGMFEKRDEFFGGGFAELGEFGLFEAVGDDAVDAAAIVAAVEVEVLLNRFGNRPGMLDDFAIHIGDVKAAIRRIGELDRAKPEVFGSDEFEL